MMLMTRRLSAETLSRLGLWVLLAYILLPFLYIWAGDTFETEAAAVIDHATVPMILGKRQFMVQTIALLSQWLQMAPFPVQRLMTIFCAVPSLWLIYLFVRRFHAITPLRFLLYSFAAPAWLVSLEIPSDTAPAFLLFLVALELALRSVWLLPVAALSAALAILYRGDALPIIGALPLTITVAAVWPRLTGGQGWGGWRELLSDPRLRRALIGAVSYFPLIYGALYLVCLPYKVTPLELIAQTLDEGASLIIPGEYRLDTWLKTFSIGWILLLPFYAGFILGEVRRSRWGWMRLWPVVPVAVYVYGYWNAICQPRYVIYIAPFLMVMTAEAIPFTIACLTRASRHGRKIFIVAAVLLVFNPLGPWLTSGRGNSDNWFERMSINMNGGRTYSPLFGGMLPAINFWRHQALRACMAVPIAATRDMIVSPDKDTVIAFVWAVEWWHYLATEVYFEHFKLKHRPFDRVDVLDRKGLGWHTLPYDPGRTHRVDDYSYNGKRTLEFYMGDGAVGLEKAQEALEHFMTVEVPSGRHAPVDFSRVQTIESWAMGSAFYPHYFNPSMMCLRATLGLGPAKDGRAAPTLLATGDIRKFNSSGSVLSAPEKAAQTKQLDERRQENKEWLDSIPDYEHRLYDRVQLIKNRQVSLERTQWLQFVVLLLAIIGSTWWFSQRKPESADRSARRTSSPWRRVRDLATRIGRRSSLAWRARRIEAKLRLMETSMGELDGDDLKTILAELREIRDDMERLAKAL
ncbi:hypothetical protein [Paramagnetospirillum kuznetsovii]|uniref:hypothetical protein n=1 Tax=Paramagnetospirillum kuznetsovii TaxID=2053833 RepID=UPI0011BF7044|nr:hypothetical protein [Paramagnetospirillum kuznetsovii]